MYAFAKPVSGDGWPLRGNRHLELLYLVAGDDGGDGGLGQNTTDTLLGRCGGISVVRLLSGAYLGESCYAE